MNRWLIIALLPTLMVARAQVSELETLRQSLKNEHTPQQRIDVLNKLSHLYTQSSLNMAEQVAHEALESSIKIGYANGIATSNNNLGICSAIRGHYTVGMEYFVKALRIREQQNDLEGQASVLGNISRLFTYQNNLDKALEYAQKALEILRKTDNHLALGKAYIAGGRIYINLQDPDHALAMFERALNIFMKHDIKSVQGWALLQLSNAYELKGDYKQALHYVFQALQLIDTKTDLFTTIELYHSIGSVYSKLKNFTEAGNYLRKAMALADQEDDNSGRLSSRLKLSQMFQQAGLYDSALVYHQAYTALYEKTFNAEKAAQLAVIENLYQSEKKDKLLELRNQRIEFQTTIIVVGSILLVMMIVLGFILYRYYQNKKQHNIKLSKLNQEIYEKHEEILVQAEELTQANQEISRINESLEAEVKIRTEKIEVQNQKLIDYAYSNAHRVRGPLARIMGLINLMQNESSQQLMKEYNEFLRVSAIELDTVIRDINKELHNE